MKKPKVYLSAKKHSRDYIPNNGKVQVSYKDNQLNFVWTMKPGGSYGWQAICTVYGHGSEVSIPSTTQKTSGCGYDKPSSAVGYCSSRLIEYVKEGSFWRYGHQYSDDPPRQITVPPAMMKALKVLAHCSGAGVESIERMVKEAKVPAAVKVKVLP